MARKALIGSVFLKAAAMALISSLVTAGAGMPQSAKGETSARAKDRLISAKLVAVPPMPDNLDKWIIENLRAWGKYRVTGDPEGADLIMSADFEEKDPQYTTKRGVVQPKKEKKHPPVLSVEVLDWVNKQPLWHADVLNDKPQPGKAGPVTSGPEITLQARGLSTDQLGAQLVRKFREYVTGLENARQKPAAER